MKQCSKCGEIKPVSEFSKNNSTSDKLQGWCKECDKQYYEENREYISQQQKQWREENPEYDKQYNEENREQRKQWREENKEHKKQYDKQYREENKKSIAEYKKQWDKENKEYILEYDRQWRKERYDNDLMFRLNTNMSSGIRKSLKYGKNGHHWEDLVGYTLEELQSHLEPQFEDWMNWNNQGRGEDYWNIDHIVPISLFEFESFEDLEFKMCWCLVNLRPLDSIENISWNNKFEGSLLEAKLILAKEAGVLEEYLERTEE